MDALHDPCGSAQSARVEAAALRAWKEYLSAVLGVAVLMLRFGC